MNPNGLEERFFLLLTRLYPGAFRRRYVSELLAFFREERARHHGLPGALRFWRRTLTDLVSAALGGRRRSIPGNQPMLIKELPRSLRLSVRGLATRPALTAVVITSLTVGMTAALVVFALVNAALLESLPFEDADQVYFIRGTLADDRANVRGASYQEIVQWRERTRSFDVLTPVSGAALNLVTDDAVERVPAELVGQGYFDLRRASPLRGRLLGDQDYTAPGADSLVVISEALWERRFDRSPDVLGRVIQLNDASFSVIGVLSTDFRGFTTTAELWLPMTAAPIVYPNVDLGSWGARWLSAAARLADGVTVEAAQADVDAAALALATERPDSNENRTGSMIALRDLYLGDTRDRLLVLLGGALLVLLIAAANVAGLLLVRSQEQSAEHALCLALGAGRGSVALRVFTDALVFTGLGAAVGWGVATLTLQALITNLPDGVLPSFIEPTLDLSSFGFAAALVLLTAAGAALVPAIWSSRGDLSAVLRGVRVVPGGRRLSAQQVIVVAEVGLALVMLIGTGLIARTFAEKLDVPLGFEPADLQVFRVRVPDASYPEPEDLVRFAELAEARLESNPDIVSATYGSDVPLRGGSSASYIALAESPEDRIRYYRHRVAADFLETLGMRLQSGRSFTDDDVAGAPDVVLISSALARRFYGDADPIGRTLIRAPGFGDIPTTIIGVVEPVRWRDLTTDLMAGADDPEVYLPFAQAPTRSIDLVVQARAGAVGLEEAVREALRDVDPEAPVYQPDSLASMADQQTAGDRLAVTVLATFGVASLVLAAVGVYGTLANAVARRQREIAIRIAVGAPAGRVRQRIVVEGVRLAAFGAIAGVAAALALGRLLTGLVFGVSVMDPLTYGCALAVVAIVAVGATWLPATRATRIDPRAALSAD